MSRKSSPKEPLLADWSLRGYNRSLSINRVQRQSCNLDRHALGEPVAPSDMVVRLNRLYEDYWEFILKEYPLTATYIGVHGFNGSLEDPSEYAFNRRDAQSEKYIDRLKGL